jgi:hypothetical protein
MKTLKIIMLIAGILGMGFGTYNIIFLGLPNQWFGFICGAYLLWLFFNIDKVYKPDKAKEHHPNP